MNTRTRDTIRLNGTTHVSLLLAAKELDVSVGVVYEAIRHCVIGGRHYDNVWWVPESEVERLFFECITEGVHLTAFFNSGLPRINDDSFSIPREAVHKGVVYVSFKEVESITGIPYPTVWNMARAGRFRTMEVIGAHRYITRREAYCLRSRRRAA